MIRPDHETLQAIASFAKSNPHFVKWISDWRAHELEKLPFVSSSAISVAQGRCQVLTEIHKLMQDSPHMVAELRKK